MLGSEIVKCLVERDIDYIGLNTDNFDLVTGCIEDVVDLGYVHSVICTAVAHTLDNTGGCFSKFIKTNVIGPYRIASEIYPRRFHFVSSDYVFCRDGRIKYTSDEQSPSCMYGFSKADAEVILSSNKTNSTIYRCGPMFGVNPCRGKKRPNIIETMVLSAKEKSTCCWSKGLANITYARDAAQIVVDEVFSEYEGYGIMHLVQGGDYSLFDVARLVYRMVGTNPELVESGEEYGHASLSSSPKTMMWDDAVVAYLKEAGHLVVLN